MEAARSLRLWRKQCEGILGFLEELKETPARGNPEWRLGMKQHYGAKLETLLKIVPMGGERSAVDYRDRLRTALGAD